MKRILIHLMIPLAACTMASAKDTIIFKNGDVLTGEILKQDANRVHFKSSAFSSVSLDTADIAEIRIDIPELGEVSVPVDSITLPDPVEPAPAKKISKTAKPVKAEPQSKKEKSKWSGQSGASIALRESNTLRRQGDKLVERDDEYQSYRLYGSVKWNGEQNDLDWNWTYRNSRHRYYKTSGDSEVRRNDDYLNLTQKYKHNFTDRWFARAKTMYQQDYRRGIDNEYLQTAEFGIDWFKSGDLQFTTSAGGGYHQYERENEKYSGAEGKFILDESIRWKIINSLTLFQKYTHLGNVEKYHFVFNSGLENKLVHDVFLRLEYRIDRDTEVEYNDKSYYDKALLTSLLYKF